MMRLGLVGYGKMGKTIEEILLNKGHSISKIISKENQHEISTINSDNTDVVIEFTTPKAAYYNIITCLENRVPVVSGSTGWLDRIQEVEKYCKTHAVGFFYASNFSLGVNLFFKLNEQLAKMMNNQGYHSEILEIHHTQKMDAPSGTAITLANDMLTHLNAKDTWVNLKTKASKEIGIVSQRIDEVSGTHEVHYSSAVDTISIRHVAHCRQGFAKGAVLAAEFLKGKFGVYSMDDLLNY